MHDDSALTDLIQRCADGELGDAQRVELLARLEADPAGYRPLALALLERHTIAAALRDMVRAPPVPRPSVAERPRDRRRFARRVAGAAAGLALGFALGWGTPRFAGSDGGAVEAGRPRLVQQVVRPPESRPAPPEPRSVTPVSTPAAFAPPTPAARLEWRTADGTPWSLPVYDAAEVSPQLAARAADPLPAGVREELIRTGRFGGELRQEYTVPLSDGRLLTIPVHAVSVREPEVF